MPATNNWNSAPSETGIPRKAFTVTPNDSTDLTRVARRLHIGTGGDIQVTLDGMTDGTYVVFKNLPSGGEKTGFFKRVWANLTSASNIVAED